MRNTIPSIIPVLGLLNTPMLAAPVDPKQFDTNKDGQLIRDTELRSYFENISELRTDEVDLDGNGNISSDELKAAPKAQNDRVDERILTMDESLTRKKSYTVAEVREYMNPGYIWPAAEGEKKKSAWTFHVRQDYEDLGVTGKVDGDSKAGGFSFSRTFGKGSQDTWDIDAALILRREIAHNVYFLPSLSLDYSDNNGDEGKNEEDALISRFAFEFVHPVKLGFTSFYRASLATATETDFDSIQEALELEWEPVVPNSLIGYPRDLFGGKLTYHLRPIIHGEFGYVFDAGSKPNLQDLERDFYSRMGPKIKLDFWTNIQGLEKFSGNLSFAHYEALGPDAESGSMFEAALKYKLDDDGNWYLQLSYENGQIPLLQDEVDKLTFGVGVKF